MSFGSIVNNVKAREEAPAPVVGDGATQLLHSDRRAMTIVEVVRFKSGARAGAVRLVRAARDTAVRVDDNGRSETQSYEFTTDPTATPYVFRTDKHGVLRSSGGSVLVPGHRDEYYDFSF